MPVSVLIMEDNIRLAEGLAAEFAHNGFLCRHVTGIRAALRAVHTHPPDLVCADYHVTDGTAEDLLAAMERGACDAVPVILVTAADAALRERCAAHERVKAVFEKPVNVAELVYAVGRFGSCASGTVPKTVTLEERRLLLGNAFPPASVTCEADPP